MKQLFENWRGYLNEQEETITLYRGIRTSNDVPSGNLQLQDRPFNAKEWEAELNQAFADMGNPNLDRKEVERRGDALTRRRRVSSNAFFSDNPDIARNYAGKGGTVYSITVPKKVAMQASAGTQAVPGKDGAAYSSNFKFNPEQMRKMASTGQLRSFEGPGIIELPTDIADAAKRSSGKFMGAPAQKTFNPRRGSVDPRIPAAGVAGLAGAAIGAANFPDTQSGRELDTARNVAGAGAGAAGLARGVASIGAGATGAAAAGGALPFMYPGHVVSGLSNVPGVGKALYGDDAGMSVKQGKQKWEDSTKAIGNALTKGYDAAASYIPGTRQYDRKQSSQGVAKELDRLTKQQNQVNEVKTNDFQTIFENWRDYAKKDCE